MWRQRKHCPKLWHFFFMTFPEWWNPNANQRSILFRKKIFSTRQLIISAHQMSFHEDELVSIDLKALFKYINAHLGGFSLHVKTAFKEPNVFVEGKFPNTILSHVPPNHPDFSVISSSVKLPRLRNKTQTKMNDQGDSSCYGWDSEHDSYPPECYCSITTDVFRDPVVAADGFTYERKAITDWTSKSRLSPMTGQMLSCPLLFPNNAMRQWIRRLS